MLTADYEQAYISTFTKIFTILKDEYELHVTAGKYENYEIKVTKVCEEIINHELMICFQKQNGSLTVIADKKIDEKMIRKVIYDVSIALNENPLASYSFKDLQDYIIYHFVYVKENVIIDNKLLLNDAKDNDEIVDLNFNINKNYSI